VAQLLPRARGVDPWVAMGRAMARVDLGGIYKGCLVPGDALRTMQAMPTMWRNTHDSGNVTIEPAGAAGATARLRGFQAQAPEWCLTTHGYIIEAVAMASGREPDVAHPICRFSGGGECVYAVSWR
jgi:hypothetical protein